MINLFLQTAVKQNISFGQINKRQLNNATFPPHSTPPLINDCFSKEIQDTQPIKPTRGKTKRGRFLKNLKNITDPYSGAIILTDDEFERYKKFVTPIQNPNSRIIAMSKYSQNMRPIEREMFLDFSKKLRKFAKENPDGEVLTFSQILQDEKPEAIKRLVKKEYDVLNKVIDRTKEMNPEDAVKVMSGVDKAIQTIESRHERFKRKDFVEDMIQLRDENKDNPDFKEIVKLANKLPNSENDKDAFIVKYADRSEEEITNRFVSSSVGNIEHIIPSSLGGSDEAFNFLLTTSGSNIERDIMDFEDYKEIHPKLEIFTQMYINDIINAIHNGELKGYEWYPYVVAPTIEQEMGIKVNLSNYKIKPKKAFRHLPERLRPYYPEYEPFFVDEKKK